MNRQEPADSCTIAFVGAGRMAREHCRAFADIPGATIAGIHSRTRAAAEALARDHGVSGVWGSIEALYERTRAHLVVVAVPELATNEIGRACFQYPWTVLIEKPPGYDLSDAIEIRDAAREAGRRVIVGLNRRFYSSTLTASDELTNVTGPRFIKVLDQHSQSEAIAAGRPDIVVQNWMYANAIHTIDYLRIFGRGRITSVRPVIPWRPSAPAVVAATVGFSSGDEGLYEGIWHGPGPWGVTITTPGSRWEMRPLESLETQQLGLPPVRRDVSGWDQLFKPGFRRQAAEAVRAALGLPSASVEFDDALETMRLISEIFAESA